MLKANIDFDTKPLVAPNDSKIFGTVDTAVDFTETWGKDLSLKRALCTLQRGPVRFYRDNVIVCDENEDAADYIFFVVSGVVHGSGRRKARQCPLWVISGHFAMRERCPLYPRKRTLRDSVGMSVQRVL